MHADWNKFRNIICHKLVLNLAPKNTCDIRVDSSVEKLTSIILDTAQETIPKRKVVIYRKNLLNYIRQLKKYRNAIRRIY